MPGNNCAIVGCGSCKGRNRGLSFHRIRKHNDPEWERALINAVSRADANFNKDRATICSRHFKPECFKVGKTGGRTLVHGSLPTECMPEKSIVIPKTTRAAPVPRDPPDVPLRVKHFDLDDVRKDCSSLPTPWCLISSSDDEVAVAYPEGNCMLRIKVCVRSNLQTSVFVLGLSAHHLTGNIEISGLKSYLTDLGKMHLCPRIVDANLQTFADIPSEKPGQLYFRHVLYGSADCNITCQSTVRSTGCHLLTKNGELSNSCKYAQQLLKRKLVRRKQSETTPMNKNHLLHKVARQKLKAAFKQTRQNEIQLQKQLNDFKRSMNKDSVQISPSLHASLVQAVEENDIANPLAKLFWEEQNKAFKTSPKGMRWHPQMIRLAILLHSRKAAAYDTLRRTGVLHLPGDSTLREYTNVCHPKAGFSSIECEELAKPAKDYKENQRFVVLLHHEMTIKSDLVFDRRSGEMVGFINAGPEQNQLATHALVFYVVGVSSNLRASLGFFGTNTVTADILYTLFWKAVGLLEKKCHLKVIASTSDKAIANQRFHDIHRQGRDVTYKTRNIFAQERDIFFISDAPHLLKTVRNNLFNSGSGKCTRYLWLNGQHLLWKHLVDVYIRDAAQELHRTKLTSDHVYLNSHSIMNVRLAAQVLSFSVGTIMKEFGGPDCQETAKFILRMDRFFDCMNTRSPVEAEKKKKPDLAPYRSVDDERFTFFADFMQFLEQWKTAVQNRQGQFSQSERNKMFISHQTVRGLCMTSRSFPEAARYLLSQGVEFILSNRFCQDPLEQHFGRQRGMGRRNDNPNLWMFGYNERNLGLQRNLVEAIQPKGCVERCQEAKVTVSGSPLKKKRKQ